MESKRHVSGQDSILSPRALPTLSSVLTALYLLPHTCLLSPVTSVQQAHLRCMSTLLTPSPYPSSLLFKGDSPAYKG